eukprot:c807_g1_i1.p1 GENE.c807_g1_i1~~c807_g1_i1.p1  ORF type:complete len:858 (-),score=175.49 c807_g1_i1:59-2260(-)
MDEGPDLLFKPPVPDVELAAEQGPTHTTHRNMVYEGDSMITIDPISNIDSSMPADVIDKLEIMDHSDMPLTKNLDGGPDCVQEEDVRRIGKEPEFNPLSPLIPTKASYGAAPEFNSLKDFTAGLPEVRKLSTFKAENVEHAAPTPHPAEDSLNPVTVHSVNVVEDFVEMPFKFSGSIQFSCTTNLGPEAEVIPTYGVPIRKALAMATAVPLGNVELNKFSPETSVFSFEIGAAALSDVRVEVSGVRKFIEDGRFMQVVKLALPTFPSCFASIVTLGDGTKDDGLMPEPTLQQQLGPPGGHEDDALSPDEMRERVRVREAMTYGEYSKPGKFNLANLSPHTYANGQAPKYENKFYVVGRLKFLVPEADLPNFHIYAEVLARGLAWNSGAPFERVSLNINGKPEKVALAPSVLIQTMSAIQHSPDTLQFVQLETSLSDSNSALVDFEIPAISLQDARQIQSKLVENFGLIDGTRGFTAFLRNDATLPRGLEFTLLFLEIHGFDGMLVDEECDDDDDDEALPVAPVNMTETTKTKDCVETGSPTGVSQDQSTLVRTPQPSSDDWPGMTGNLTMKTYMELPGRQGYDRLQEPGEQQDRITPGQIVSDDMQDHSKDTSPGVSDSTHRPRPAPQSFLAQVGKMSGSSEEQKHEMGQLLKPRVHDAAQLLGEAGLVQLDSVAHAATPGHLSMQESLATYMSIEQAIITSPSQVDPGMPEAAVLPNTPAGGYPTSDLDPGI